MPWETDGDGIRFSGHLTDLMTLIMTCYDQDTEAGTVTATPTGVDRALNCGSNCSAKFVQNTLVTLTATPPVGKTFANWSGACSGTAPTCACDGANCWRNCWRR